MAKKSRLLILSLFLIPLLIFVAIFLAKALGDDYLRHLLEFGDAAAVDQAGNIFISGVSRSTFTQCFNCLLSKYDKDGKRLWRRQGVALDEDFLHTGLALDKQGNAYVFCEPGRTTKYDSDGKQLWAVPYTVAENSAFSQRGIAADHKGNAYVIGTVSGYEWPELQIVIIKYDAKGKQLWIRSYRGPENYCAASSVGIVVDDAGSTYVAGYIESKDVSQKFLTLKYDTDGTLLWEAIYGDNTGSSSMAFALVLDSKRNVCVTGLSTKSENRLTPGCADEILTVRYDPHGNREWVGRYHHTQQKARACLPTIITDEGDNVYIGASPRLASSDANTVIVKYNADGKEQWAVKYEPPRDKKVLVYDLRIDRQNNMYAIGYADSDMLIIKYDPNGRQKQITRLDSVSEYARFLSSVSQP